MRNIVQNFLLILFIFSGILASAQEYGLASYYDDDFHGRKTANGELYDKGKLTAAHKTLPYGTMIKVSRIDNGKSVEVRINDNGPYIKGRVVDLSKAAAAKLGIIELGEAEVNIEVLGMSSSKKTMQTIEVPTKTAKVKKIPEEYTPKSVQPIIEARVPKPKSKPKVKKEVTKKTTKPKSSSKKTAPAPTDTDQKKMKKATRFNAYDLYQVQLYKPKKKGFGVQVASVSSYEGAMKFITSLQAKWFDNILLSIEPGTNGKDNFKIILGPFADRDTANSYKKHLSKKKKIKGFVIDLEGIDY